MNESNLLILLAGLVVGNLMPDIPTAVSMFSDNQEMIVGCYVLFAVVIIAVLCK